MITLHSSSELSICQCRHIMLSVLIHWLSQSSLCNIYPWSVISISRDDQFCVASFLFQTCHAFVENENICFACLGFEWRENFPRRFRHTRTAKHIFAFFDLNGTLFSCSISFSRINSMPSTSCICVCEVLTLSCSSVAAQMTAHLCLNNGIWSVSGGYT